MASSDWLIVHECQPRIVAPEVKKLERLAMVERLQGYRV